VGQDGKPQVPAGDLNLTDGASDEEPDQFRSYRQLFFAHNGQKLDETGQLIDECIQFAIDPVTGLETTTCAVFRQVQPPMSGCCARNSTRFFSKFDAGGGTVDHRGFLNPSELKLLSEWLDSGAQYHNDPFFVPPVN
jgi:hypothetical protein